MTVTLQKPIVARILPFDPTKSYTITFLYSGGQVYKNRAVIKDNDTNETVYDETISSTTPTLAHEIKANTLIAGKRYTVQVQVFDENDNSSMLSDPVLFCCLSTPSFYFSNLTQGQTYRNASIELKLEYSQTEGENIRSYQFMQYSEDMVLISSSKVEYVNEESTYTYTFHNLNNNSVYNFRAIGETVNGIILDTGDVKVNIMYEIIPSDLVFKVTNEYCEGYISLNSNIRIIEHEFENDNYILEDGLLKLKDNSLTYEKGLLLDEDFALFIEAKTLPVSRFFRTNDDELTLEIINICDVYYCRLNVKDTSLSLFASMPKAVLSTNGRTKDTDSANSVDVINTSYDDNELIIFEVKRKGSLYSLKVYYKTEQLS